MDSPLDRLWLAATKGMNDIYKKPPQAVVDRLAIEMNHIRNSGQAYIVTLIKELRDYAAWNQLPLVLNGTAGGSLILFLLGISASNPMPPHYNCNKCGHYEWVDTLGFGIDLEDKQCPSCGTDMGKDGFRIPLESIWYKGEGRIRFDFITVQDFIDFCEKRLWDYFSDDERVFPYCNEIQDSQKADVLEQTGFCLLPFKSNISAFQEYARKMPDGRTCLAFPQGEYDGIVETIQL